MEDQEKKTRKTAKKSRGITLSILFEIINAVSFLISDNTINSLSNIFLLWKLLMKATNDDRSLKSTSKSNKQILNLGLKSWSFPYLFKSSNKFWATILAFSLYKKVAANKPSSIINVL